MKAAKILTAWGRILNGFPPLLSIEITRDCPLNCPGCYAYGDQHLGGEITLRQLRDLHGEPLVDGILSLVKKHRPLRVSLVGGEPLLRHRELSQVLPVLNDWGIDSLVVSSGIIPIPKEWGKLERVRVVVSVDGLPPEHNRRRAPATYDRILKNIEGCRVHIGWVVTNQQASRPHYLEDYLAFWTARPETRRIWLSLYTPQKGEQSPEILTPESRRQVLKELPALKEKYPAVILPLGAVEAFAQPPADPGHCTFARLSTNYSADLKTLVKPCFYGGDPDCSQCGCAVSAALHWIHEKPLAMGLKVGHVLDWLLMLGERSGSVGKPGPQSEPQMQSIENLERASTVPEESRMIGSVE